MKMALYRFRIDWSVGGALVFALVFAVALAQSVAAAEKMWQLKQASEIYGPITTSYCQRGVRIEAPSRAFLVTTDIKHTIILNPSDKTYADFDLKKYYRPKINPVQPKIVGSDKLLGFTATAYATAGSKNEIHKAWMTKQIPMPKQSLQALTGLNEFPGDLGVPLKYVRKNQDGQMVIMLDTMSAKELPLNPGLFAVPADYKRIVNEIDMFIPDEAMEQDSGEMMKSSGISTPALEHSKRSSMEQDADDLMQASQHPRTGASKKN
jgi:uncharacterized protein DUF4412